MTGCTVPDFPRKATGGRAPAISLCKGRQALSTANFPKRVSRFVMRHDGTVNDFLFTYLDSIDDRLLEYPEADHEQKLDAVRRLRVRTTGPLDGSIPYGRRQPRIRHLMYSLTVWSVRLKPTV